MIILFVIALSQSPDNADVGASAYRMAESIRAQDSVAVLALATTGTTLSADSLLVLEAALHEAGFTIEHNSAHARYARIMLDSAEVLAGRGMTFAARGLLGSLGLPLSTSDSARAARLTARIVRLDEEEAREGTRRQRRNQEVAAETRIQQIRNLRQGKCTPPVRAVRNRVRKNPDWPDEVIATTACNRVHIGMTREQAIAGWGRPRDINRTSATYGVHEQWVYGEYGSGYLYFEDGILTTIQN